MDTAPPGQESAVADVAGRRAPTILTRDGGAGAHISARACPAMLARIRAIAHALEAEPGLTARELAERIGLERRDAVLLLLRLEERGHVVHEGRRWFPGDHGVR
jgi:hypothetical protein